mgnify:CR=1 FL=1
MLPLVHHGPSPYNYYGKRNRYTEVDMATLTERLELRLPPELMRLLRQEAQRRGVSVAQLVREAIESSLMGNRQARIQAAEELFQVEAPVSEWPKMKKEIEEAHLGLDKS